MATEILLNDGGAPARILPFTAKEAISAGDLCSLDGTVGLYPAGSQIQPANSGDTGYDFAGIGWALTDIASGSVGSVITGHGVILNINVADLGSGVALMMGTTDGRMLTATNAAGVPSTQAVTLEVNAAAGLTRCITV